MRAFPVEMPSGLRYWTVLDPQLEVVAAADQFLRQVRLGKDGAELTTRTYAGALALYLRWCDRTRRDWRTAAADMGLFITWLRYAKERGEASTAAGAQVLAGPGRPVRGARRINLILTVVRSLLMHGVSTGSVPADVVPMLYEVGDSRGLPVEAQGEDGRLFYQMRAHHRLSEPYQPVDRATDEEAIALLRACRSCRDRLMVLLMARAGLRRGELVGLRREDMHFLVDSTPLGCSVPRSHLHVVRRDNANGAWAKSRRTRWVPVDSLVVLAHDQYVFERERIAAASDSDFMLVNLFRGRIGAPMKPDAVNDLLTSLGSRAGLDRQVTPHMLRHVVSA